MVPLLARRRCGNTVFAKRWEVEKKPGIKSPLMVEHATGARAVVCCESGIRMDLPGTSRHRGPGSAGPRRRTQSGVRSLLAGCASGRRAAPLRAGCRHRPGSRAAVHRLGRAVWHRRRSLVLEPGNARDGPHVGLDTRGCRRCCAAQGGSGENSGHRTLRYDEGNFNLHRRCPASIREREESGGPPERSTHCRHPTAAG